MSVIPFSLRAPPPLRTLVLALAAGLLAAPPVGLAAGPFQSFAGGWSGVGQVVGSNGHHEAIRCRAEYSEAKGGAALNQTIVCASESFKLDIHSYVEALRGIGPGILAGIRSRCVRPHHRPHRGGPVRGRDRRSHFHCRGPAHLQRPDANRELPASRGGHFRRPRRTQTTRLRMNRDLRPELQSGEGPGARSATGERRSRPHRKGE